MVNEIWFLATCDKTKKKIKTEKIDENDNMWLICKIRVTFMCIVYVEIM